MNESARIGGSSFTNRPATKEESKPRLKYKIRADMSGRILDRYYDKGSYDKKAERRRDHLKDV